MTLTLSLTPPFVGIKSAFDSVDRNKCSLESFMHQKAHLTEDIRTHTGAPVRIGNKFSRRFSTTSGVTQGCILAPSLFLVAIDWILGHPAPDVGMLILTILPSLCLISHKQTVSSNQLMPSLLHCA